MKKCIKYSFLPVWCLLILVFSASYSTAAVLLVPQQFTQIQQAITYASSGDTILVGPGTYSAINFMGKSLHIKSSHGPAQTVIAHTNQDYISAVLVQSGELIGTTLEGFRITGGKGTLRQEGSLSVSYGGGVFVDSSYLALVNVIIEDNVLYGAICGGRVRGAGVGARNATLHIENSTIRSNETLGCSGVGYGGNGLAAINSQVSIYNSHILNNAGNFGEASGPGGAIYAYDNAEVTVRSSILANNKASLGGAIAIGLFASVDVANSILANNLASGPGGAVHVQAGSCALNQSTIYGNQSNYGGAVYASSCFQPTEIKNSIIWNNNSTAQPGIVLTGWSTNFDVNTNLIQGGYYFGTNIIDAEPQFVNAAAQNFSLQANSPAIDAGNIAFIPDGINLDLVGNPRVVGASVDLGPLEFQNTNSCIGDINGDGTVDMGDLLMILSAWGGCQNCAADLNADGLVDMADLLILLANWGSACR